MTDISAGDMNCTGVEFKSCEFEHAFFERSNFVGCLFDACDLKSCDFQYVKLENTRFENVILDGVDFGGACLKEVEFIESDLSRIHFDSDTYFDDEVLKHLSSEQLQEYEQLKADKESES